MMDRCNPSARMSAENRRDRHFYTYCIVVLINLGFTDSNMVHEHGAGAPQPNGKGDGAELGRQTAGAA